MHTITTDSIFVNVDSIAPDIQFARYYQGTSGGETPELTLYIRDKSEPLHVSGVAAQECWANLKQFAQVQVGESETQKTRVQSAGTQR